MKPLLDRFILGFPILFLKQYPYAWIVLVALWPRSRSFGAFLLGIIVVCMLLLRWQCAAWISQMRRRYADQGGKFFIDRPSIQWTRAARNIAFLVAGSVFAGFLFRGQFGMTFWQILVMMTGFTVLYQDTYFFGRETTYIITATGIGIHFVPGHFDYRLFLPFREISRIDRLDYQESIDTSLFARTHDVKSGLLMIPKDPNGFTRTIYKLFIAPKDLDKFVEQLPYGFGRTA